MSKLRVEAGRCITRSDTGLELYTLRRVGNNSEGYTTSPTDADTFVRTTVHVLNTYADLVEALELYLKLDNDNRASCEIKPEDWSECWQAAQAALAKAKETD